MSIHDLAAKESAETRAARAKLQKRVHAGAERQKTVIEAAMSTIIVDRLVPPKKLSFGVACEKGTALQLHLVGREDIDPMYIHPHALGQMSDSAGITRTYATRLNNGQKWMRDLLALNYNELFRNTEFKKRGEAEKKFMVRTVGNQVRGFLSQNFNRKLGTATMLRAFVEGCAEHQAGPVDASHSDTRTHVRCVLPVVFEPVDGEFVAFGVTFTNSDFGAGRLGLSETVLRINSGTISVMEDKLRRSHIGPAVEGDFELSAELEDEETKLVQKTIKEVVGQVLSFDTIEKNLEAIQLAHEHEIPWYKLKEKLKNILTEEELTKVEVLLEEADVVDLPTPSKGEDGKNIATAWWAANTVSFMAAKIDNPDRKADLQSFAGELMKS